MTDIPTIAESAQAVIFYSKLNIAVSVMNMIGAGLLIYGSFQLRKGARLNMETAALLRRAAQGTSPGTAETGTGSGA
jgi:hypothetical protein